MATPIQDGLGASMIGVALAAARPAPASPGPAAAASALVAGGRLSTLGVGLVASCLLLAYWYGRIL